MYTIDPTEPWSLKDNYFYILDIFDFIPDDYDKEPRKIYKIPYTFREKGIILFSGNVKGLPLPPDTISKDVFVGVKMEGMEMDVKKVKPGDCIIICDFFCMVSKRETVMKYFTDIDLCTMPINLS